MNRPYVICHAWTSLDGKINGPYINTDVAKNLSEECIRLRSEFQADAWMCGFKTANAKYCFSLPPKLQIDAPTMERKDHVAVEHAEDYVVVVDPEGTLAWNDNTVSNHGETPTAHVVEVVTEKVTNAYLAYLHKLNISYIFAGKEEIDYPLLMEKLYDLFHIETLLLEGNGLLNGLILNANLLDEVSMVVIPASDSSTASYSLFDVPPQLGGGRTTTVFSLKSMQQLGENGLWIRYLVKR